MIFRYPWVLTVLLLLPLLAWLRVKIWPSPALRFSSVHQLRKLPASWAVRVRWLLPACFYGGLAFVIIAAARPQVGLQQSDVRTEGVDIALLVDVSTSMRAIDFSTSTKRINRLDAAKTVIEDFISSRSDDRIGMVTFAALPYTIAPLTLDHDWLSRQLERVQTGMLEDGTAIGSAIASAVNRLRDSDAESKVIILLTDGENNAGSISPENAALAAEALDIKIYTVGAGKSGMVQVPVQDPFGQTRYVNQVSRIDEATLQRLADITGAQYFRATDMDSLQSVYAEIDRMEKSEININEYTSYEERFSPFMWAGILLLIVEALLRYSRMGRVL